ncbi:DEAD/DEAH box helicase [Caulobacter sp. 602-1]|uniref:DEAD/DEAH box helicase n=1 Tax=Caulobacter sp. 602-1 TaxID=2492472 RepID=UPI000F6419ED|nr:DEAD/DEAH box helicase [Caulobacter sp. 602-1]RRN63468.1 DEAD/DEAH box helicase [Caulobacter sp. 602-1]
MSKRLIETLARAGVEPLYGLAGKSAVDLLERLEVKALNAHTLATIVVERLGASAALGARDVRALTLDSLKGEEAEQLREILGLPAMDPFEALSRVDFDRSQGQLATLHAFFGVAFEVDDAEEKIPLATVTSPYTLFAHQRRASLAVREKLKPRNARVLLHMPTGAGKTRTAMTTIVDLLRELPDGQVVVWLAHSEELCDQAFDEAVKAWTALGPRPFTVYRHYGDHRIGRFETVKDGFIVASLQLLYKDSLARQGEILDLAGRVKLIVMDEAHQATAPTYSHLINLLQRRPATGVLGLSATPGRSLKDVGADLKLAAFFNRQKVKLEIDGYSNPVEYLTAEGYLAKTEFIRLPFEPKGDVTLTDVEAARIGEGFDLPLRVIEQLAADDARNLLILQAVEAEVANGGKIILFAMSVEHASLLASVLRLRGVAAAAVTSSTPKERRRQVIQRYRETDEIDVLCNYGVLTTGFDAPKTNVAFIARPTTSVSLYSQMIGRAARGKRAGGNDTCRVLTVVDQAPGFRSLADGFAFWDDIWEGE